MKEKCKPASAGKKDRKSKKSKCPQCEEFISRQDAAGSYTGNPLFGEEPEQDADDL